MARGLCFQSLCAVIAVLVVAPVRSDHVEVATTHHELQQGRLHANVIRLRHSMEAAMYTTVTFMMGNLKSQMNKSTEEFHERLEYMRFIGMPTLKRNISMTSEFENTFRNKRDFSALTKAVDDNVVRLEHSLDRYKRVKADFLDMKEKQEVLAYYMAFDLSITQSMRAVMNKIPDSKTLFQTVYPVHLADGLKGRSGRVQMELGPTEGTVCRHGTEWKLINVVCRQLGFTGPPLLVKPPIWDFGSLFLYARDPGPFLLDGVSCHGYENHLLLCASEPLLDVHQDCTHGSDVGIFCR